MYKAAAAAGGAGSPGLGAAADGVAGMDALVEAFRAVLTDEQLDGSFQVCVCLCGRAWGRSAGARALGPASLGPASCGSS